MRFGPATEGTFVPGDVGRRGRIALWDRDDGSGGTDDRTGSPRDHGRAGEVTIGFPDGARTVAADLVDVADGIGPLASLPAGTEVRPSMRALAVATRLALDLVSRGRLLPAAAADGADEWRVGPLDVADRSRVEQLADAVPAPFHAVPLDEPGRILSPHAATSAYLDAVADAFVRTSSAPAVTGSDAFAAPGATDVTAVESWLQSVTAGTGGDTLVGLRVELPGPRRNGTGDEPDDEPGDDVADAGETDGDEPVRCVLQIQSRLDPSLVLDAAQLWSAPGAVIARFGGDVETDLLLTLRRAASVWPPAGRLLQEAAPEELELTDDEVEDLFGPVADDLAAAGLPILWPSEIFASIELRPVVGTASPDAVGGTSLDLSSLGEVRWDATVDGADLTEHELLQLAEAKRPVVRLRGRWVRADPARLRKLNERTDVGLGDVLAAALSGTVSVEGEQVEAQLTAPLVELADRLHRIDTVRTRDAPPGLDAELRPYQQRGLAWMAEMAELGLGGILADDMGLGKTIQLLALHLLRRGSGPTLVVCPASLMSNWEREAARFVPDVPVHRHHGSGRDIEAVRGAVSGTDVAGDAIVVCTYGIARRDAAELATVPWGMVVADEAQTVKNPLSRTARAIRSIPAGARFALTGTPVENRLADLWALLDWTTPGLLGNLETFQREVATPIERERDGEATARLAAVVQPFVLRRRKSDPTIAPDLPPKTETDHFVGLTVEQATLYKAVVAELRDDVAEAEGFSRKGLVLKLLTALKQICNHPAQYLGQEGPIQGRSGKLEAVTDLLDVVIDEGEAALVFTQYVGMGHLIGAHLRSRGVDSQFLHGSVPVARREEMVDRFQAGDVPVFVVSLKAGGTGLNLTRATHVFHYDRWWNPAVEDQASDRAWRIGQEHPVQVHRMVCEGTLEERIAVLLESKKALAESVVVGGETWVSELSDDELWALIDLEEPS